MKRILAALLFLMLSAPAWGQDFEKSKQAYLHGDYATALREWRLLAEQGNANAQAILGEMYAKGIGVLRHAMAENAGPRHLRRATPDQEDQTMTTQNRPTARQRAIINKFGEDYQRTGVARDREDLNEEEQDALDAVSAETWAGCQELGALVEKHGPEEGERAYIRKLIAEAAERDTRAADEAIVAEREATKEAARDEMAEVVKARVWHATEAQAARVFPGFKAWAEEDQDAMIRDIITRKPKPWAQPRELRRLRRKQRRIHVMYFFKRLRAPWVS